MTQSVRAGRGQGGSGLVTRKLCSQAGYLSSLGMSPTPPPRPGRAALPWSQGPRRRRVQRLGTGSTQTAGAPGEEGQTPSLTAAEGPGKEAVGEGLTGP